MGFLNSLGKIFPYKGIGSSEKNKAVRCDELIRLISFAQKTKPLMGGNYGITVTYDRPRYDRGEYVSRIKAEFGFYDFDCIRFAREYAIGAVQNEVTANMVRFYYDKICSEANLTPNDWPYKMDIYDFTRMIANTDQFGLYSLIPHASDEDIFTIRIWAGSSAESGVTVYKSIEKDILDHFPYLYITKGGISADRCMFHINI